MARVINIRLTVKRRAKGHCEICGVNFCPKPHRPKSPSMHHLFPQRDGGRDDIGNLIYICLTCHTTIHNDEATAYCLGRLRMVDSPLSPVFLSDWVILGEKLSLPYLEAVNG